MTDQPTYEFYEGTYKGVLAADRFGALVRAAAKEVDAYILPNEPDGSDEYLLAVCAAADVIDAHGGTVAGGDAGGFSIGSFSMGARSQADAREALDADLADAIERELAGTGLLYWGIC